jgi:GH25 family lysozyme M1 (1,4-beta-N-acetylmuramidase)
MTTETRPALRYPGYVDGLDISAVQVITDAKAVAEDGFIYATVKASEGVMYCDPRALENLERLRDVGLICNVYTFLRPSQGRPVDQVQKAFECAGDTFTMRLALDLEGAPNGMPPEGTLAFAEECVDECLHHGVLAPEFYSDPAFIRERMMPALASSKVIGECALWIAQYRSTTTPWLPPKGYSPWTPQPWTRWTKHQYSGNGGYRVRGIVGDCDRDLFNGDLAMFKAYMGLPDELSTEPTIVVHPAVPLTQAGASLESHDSATPRSAS